MILPLLARVLRLASVAICAIAILWFVSFALDQSKAASSRQQAEVAAAESAQDGGGAAKKPSAARKALDKAVSTLSSPFSSVTSGSSSAWTIHIVDTLLVLVVYGFGLAFVARLMRLNP
ncbi:MAG TPA: hypothetical protein VHT29_10040 [Solirubrobacteraceae bacterium]|jgi:hypothetical protein|nr:hypothetical protein [Solirubrobacteraceae bacterium]